MLGFSALSQTAFSESNTVLAALAFVAGATSVGSITATGFDAKAEITTPSAVSTTAVALQDVDAQAVTGSGSVFATHGIDAFTDVDAQATTVPTGVVSTFDLDIGFDAKAITSMPSATALFDLGIGFDAQATTDLGNTLAATAISPFSDVYAQASTVPTSVSATFTANAIDTAAAANTTSNSVISTFAAGTLFYDAKAEAGFSGVELALAFGNYSDVDAQAAADITSVSAIIQANIETPTAVRFPYDPEVYNRSRTVYLVTYGDNNTVHIREHNTTIYTAKVQGDNTVHVKQSNRTVYVSKVQDNNTVHITA